MAFCANCGASVEGRFCAKCGSVVGADPAPQAPPPPGAGYQQPGAGYQQQPAGAAGMTDNVAGALCYAFGLITGILFLVLAPYNQNKAIRFHAFQSIFLNLAAILLSIVLNIVFGVMFGFVGLMFGLRVQELIWLAVIVLWLYMLISTYQGKTVVLPIIGPIAQQQA